MNTKTIFQSICQGILICDRTGRIIYFNEAYGSFIGKTLSQVQGMPIRKLRPHSRVPDVLRSGIALEGLLRHETKISDRRDFSEHPQKDQEYFVNIYPIIEGNEVTGSISIVTTITLARQQEESRALPLRERVAQFEQQEIRKMLDIYGHDLNGKKAAAEKLGISLSGLYAKLAESRKLS